MLHEITLLSKVYSVSLLWYTLLMKATPNETECPVTKTAELLSDTWTMRLMHALLEKPMSFCELERSLEGISTRTLTRKLVTLQEEGLIVKADTGGYAATKKGKGLRVVEQAMRTYGKKYLLK